jgi:NADH-quinone oxidoreductase subunit C
MSTRIQQLSDDLQQVFGENLSSIAVAYGEVTIEVEAKNISEVCIELRENEKFAFEQLIDLCGVDYSEYGSSEWETEESTSTGFSRGVESGVNARLRFGDAPTYVNQERPRFSVVYHLMSISKNCRLRVRAYCSNDDVPMMPSVVSNWASANWYEREAFDLFGILFEGHPDLRRILTDYGFVGHPFRKDFPMVGHVEMRYDPDQQRVVYQPVTIDPRVLVPRVIRNDGHRGADETSGGEEKSDA